jgi:hypothetical protein
MSNEARKNPSMLVHDVQTMEHPQKLIPTLARVDLAERFYNFWPEGLYWSEGFGFRRLGVIVNGEFNLAPFVGRVFSTDKKELVSEVIQGGSEGVDDFTNQRATQRRERLDLSQIKEGLSSLRVWMSADTVCAVFGPTPHVTFEITALFLGPFNAL